MSLLFKKQIERLYRPTWAEVDLKAMRYNFRQIKRRAGNAKILCVVKADAYGHGLIQVARTLQKEGADFFGVADIHEGVALRMHGIQKPILLFENCLPPFAKSIVDYRLTPSISNIELAEALNRHAQSLHSQIPIHIKVDTGMGRLGVWHKEALGFIKRIHRFKNLHWEGLLTHYACAETDEEFTYRQIRDFSKLIRGLKQEGIIFPYLHASNSIGLIEYRNNSFTLVRPGLILYGMYPVARLREKIRLKPVLSVKSKIVFLKNISKGRSISYGRTFIASKDMTIATIPIGYNDGYMRCLSNKSDCLVGGKRCRVVGRVTMDQLMVDVTHVKSARIGTEVVLLGIQKGNSISADELAQKARTINYEITCSLGNRLPRIYKD